MKNVIEEKEAALKDAPPGTLRLSVSHGYTQFYHIIDKEKPKGHYISAKNRDLAAKIAQKCYDEKILAKARIELKYLEKLIALYETGICEDIYSGMSKLRQNLIMPVMESDEEYVAKWLDEEYDCPGFGEDDPEYYSERGLRVRSKSEVEISDKYDVHNVPSLYETPLYLEGWGTVSPDFKLLNVRLRKVFYHEHLGKMDDPEYVEKNLKKLQAYFRNGYFPGKNLILTFESKKVPFDARIMDSIIEQYLL